MSSSYNEPQRERPPFDIVAEDLGLLDPAPRWRQDPGCHQAGGTGAGQLAQHARRTSASAGRDAAPAFREDQSVFPRTCAGRRAAGPRHPPPPPTVAVTVLFGSTWRSFEAVGMGSGHGPVTPTEPPPTPTTYPVAGRYFHARGTERTKKTRGKKLFCPK
jgi:hypothetical protein